MAAFTDGWSLVGPAMPGIWVASIDRLIVAISLTYTDLAKLRN